MRVLQLFLSLVRYKTDPSRPSWMESRTIFPCGVVVSACSFLNISAGVAGLLFDSLFDPQLETMTNTQRHMTIRSSRCNDMSCSSNKQGNGLLRITGGRLPQRLLLPRVQVCDSLLDFAQELHSHPVAQE